MDLGFMKPIVFPAVLVAMAICVTRYYFPRVETRVVVQERVVVKKDVHTVVRTVVKPDGTRERIRETIDRSSSQSETKQETVSKPKESQFLITAMAVQSVQKLPRFGPSYGVGLHMRVFGPVFAGAIVGTEYAGLSLAMEF